MWRQEHDRERDETPDRQLTAPGRTPTVEADVIVPLLQAGAVGLALGLALVALGLLWWAWPAIVALKRGAAAAIVAFALGVVVYIGQQRRTVQRPIDRITGIGLLPALLAVLTQRQEQPDDDGDGWPGLVIRGMDRPSPALLADHVDQDVRPVGPQTDRVTELMYRFITTMWPTGNVSRDHCLAHGFKRAEWERLIGGRRGHEGRETGRGVLDRAGVVTRTATSWEIVVPMDQALRITPQLEQYAAARSAVVRLGQDGQDRTGQTCMPESGRPV